ncbi:MAG: bile acid:sodium symporter family protein [Sphingobacteriales bacterium]|nr:bile acid:sodium symporter family protein [Sphingobacteriales bacterium]
MSTIDQVQIQFSPGGQIALMAVLSFIMFGVALDMDFNKFREISKKPKPVLVGLLAHWMLLPLATVFLVKIIQPSPSIALGMFLVAACPSGNMATYITHLSKGNTALSISISTIIALTCFVTTPLFFLLMAKTYLPAQPLLHQIDIDIFHLIAEIGFILGLPMLIAVILIKKKPVVALKIKKPISIFSFVLFIIFLVVAFIINKAVFIEYVPAVAWIVAIHNAVGFLIGFVSGKLAGVKIADAKTIAIECGIQNTGLGLVLIFSFFGGLGGMALIAAWWGIYHIIAGISLSYLFRKIV